MVTIHFEVVSVSHSHSKTIPITKYRDNIHPSDRRYANRYLKHIVCNNPTDFKIVLPVLFRFLLLFQITLVDRWAQYFYATKLTVVLFDFFLVKSFDANFW